MAFDFVEKNSLKNIRFGNAKKTNFCRGGPILQTFVLTTRLFYSTFIALEIA